MDPIRISKTPLPSLEDILDLYGDAGWLAYTRDPQKLDLAIQNSLQVLTAWDGARLVGLIRAVGDVYSILYIQDILVLKAYKRRGIGRKLMQEMLSLYPDIRQTVLLTDESEESRGFYEALGFSSCDQGKTVAFVLFREVPGQGSN